MRIKASYTTLTIRIDNDNVDGSKDAIKILAELLADSASKTDLCSKNELAITKKENVIELITKQIGW